MIDISKLVEVIIKGNDYLNIISDEKKIPTQRQGISIGVQATVLDLDLIGRITDGWTLGRNVLKSIARQIYDRRQPV